MTALCSVCSAPSHGIHFGAPSCRACAAFFKRSIVGKRSYKCNHTGGKCSISKDVRCMCRSCRLRKCLAVGMIPDGIAKHGTSPSPSTSRSMSGDAADDVIELSCAESLYPSLKRVESGLTALIEDFKSYTKCPGAVSYEAMGRYSQEYVSRVESFIQKHFFGIHEFTDKEILYMTQRFALKFLFLSSGQVTLKSTRQSRCYDRVYFYDGNFADLNNLEHYFSCFKGDFTAADAARVFRPSFDKIMSNLVKPMDALRITDIELAAIMILVFFEPGIEELEAQCDEKVLKCREKVLRELMAYYEFELRITDVAMRMAKLIMFLPCLERVVDTFREDMQINKIFTEPEGQDGHMDIFKRFAS